jgi:hypothetical protein
MRAARAATGSHRLARDAWRASALDATALAMRGFRVGSRREEGQEDHSVGRVQGGPFRAARVARSHRARTRPPDIATGRGAAWSLAVAAAVC